MKANYHVAESGCWVWDRSTNDRGYPLLRGRRASHLYLEDAGRPVPAGSLVTPSCYNRLCVNPDHLEVVDASQFRKRPRPGKRDPDPGRKLTDLYYLDDRGCWVWVGGKSGNGVPMYTRKLRAADVILDLVGRPVPSGSRAYPSCGNLVCVNPDHLHLTRLTPTPKLVNQ